MTVQGAVGQLTAAVEQLWIAVCEFTLIVAEDQPRGEGLAVSDQLVETVSEVQGEVAAARSALTDGASLPLAGLPQVAAHLHRAGARYWRDVRGHEPVAQLRAATRQRGGEWTAWRRSVEQSAARLADPLESVADALDAGWQELCQVAATAPGPWHTPSERSWRLP